MIIENSSKVKLIQKFISKNFKKNHILSKNKKVFDWLYYNKKEKKYNFIFEEKNKNIISFLGIVKNSKFSNSLKKNESIWFATWAAKKKELGAGLRLLNYAIENYNYTKIGTAGCTEEVKQFYKYLGFFTGHMKHYYIPNAKINSYKICKFKKKYKKKIKFCSLNKSVSLKIVKKIDFKEFNNDKKKYIKIFSKDENYFKNKYIKNPFYKYIIYEFKINKKLLGYYFAREAFYKNSKCLRIVDFFGDIKNIFNSSLMFKKIIEDNKYEFVDMYFFGNENNKSLFIENKFDKNIIIPNFFEPFIKKNIKINFAILTKKPNKFFLFKGDGDQERPNILEN